MLFGRIGKYSHIIGVCDLSLLVTDDWEAQLAAGNLIDILDPSSVRLDGVGRKTDQLNPTLGELRLELCECTELGGADGSVIFRVGEQNNPLVANELVEVDGTLSGLGLEVGGNGTQTEAGRGKSANAQENTVKLDAGTLQTMQHLR